ncbi:hypothetical protein [Rhodoplanes serenus]|uniref:hypothetical protein n=1 Tax=Rhodoplanes serenus TaxID=200615 RepID=UPI0011B93967|nr:hypothetical protein [Rhodoplanes serenus]
MASKTGSGQYSLKLVGPGHSFERPISEEVATQVIQLVMGATVSQAAFPAVGASTRPDAQSIVAHQRPTSAKHFLLDKKPKNAYQRVACLAYYLTHFSDTPQFKTEDITKANTDAAQPRLSNPSLAVSHATNTYNYLSPVGGGKKQLTALGEAVVDALPDLQKVKSLQSEHKPRRKRTTRPSKAKKSTK